MGPEWARQTTREKMVRLSVEMLETASFHVSIQALLSLCSSGRATHAIMRLNFVGRELTAWLQKRLNERGDTCPTSAERETVRDVKEKLAYLALDIGVELQEVAATTDCNASDTVPNGERDLHC
jgi:actin-related protein